jgi:hypothetical protein
MHEAELEIKRRQEAAKKKNTVQEFGTLSECEKAKLIAFGRRYDVFSREAGKQWKLVCQSYSKDTAQKFYNNLAAGLPLIRIF